ncbi:His-Xaa-Ser system radical SAM maturase HxsB [Polynucleobacter sp. MWH-Jannik1A5]|uniref:His-Xaa-Ser system radical SAM maturase HxsB n=1 Tax=Polynucleobacter sp. MWH-Jannik1A5 TaxID=1855890 RepID=UPI001C0BD8EF|nr:His-Xaa-Ser system radical SAM maturase HxsB [Polynucleobacter sp. MWH-Jannik1A5]MBU3547470.1 His-Xaa-Ser system radical SAM maturase HxsB [Polynucleobacter sp. MWH-Jannik1A5]
MSKFQKIEFFKKEKSQYSLLPFRFDRLDGARCVLTNLAGEYLVISDDALKLFVSHELDDGSQSYIDLRAKHFLVDGKTNVAKELLEVKLRTKYANLSEFTALHMFVVSLRCEHSCPYCQVSRQSDDKMKYDMTEEIADKAIDLALRSPARAIKIEFQGGEPLLNFPIIKYIVEQANFRKGSKNVSYVIATNLALINEEILDYCKSNAIQISTSLDGPKDLHNSNRPRPGKNSYEKAVSGIKMVRERLGFDAVSALMTTTAASLDRVEEIIDEYINQNMPGIFLRPLSPYGFALKTKTFKAYGVDQWNEFYFKGLEYIIDLNRRGIEFKEYYAATILAKMFTSQDPGYVDLMSPAGIGISAIIYNYDGTVYPSDESRMLAEMGDDSFKLGNVLTNSYEEIFLNDVLLNPIEESFSYSVPMCNDCAFEDYCGADPVFHHGIYGDFVARKPDSQFCQRNMAIFKYLINKMESDPFVKRLFMLWGQPHA